MEQQSVQQMVHAILFDSLKLFQKNTLYLGCTTQLSRLWEILSGKKCTVPCGIILAGISPGCIKWPTCLKQLEIPGLIWSRLNVCTCPVPFLTFHMCSLFAWYPGNSGLASVIAHSSLKGSFWYIGVMHCLAWWCWNYHGHLLWLVWEKSGLDMVLITPFLSTG